MKKILLILLLIAGCTPRPEPPRKPLITPKMDEVALVDKTIHKTYLHQKFRACQAKWNTDFWLSSSRTCCDFNGDGIVNFYDYSWYLKRR